MKKQIEAGEKPDLNIYFAGSIAIADFVSDMDLVITLCDVPNGRPSFGMSKGGGEIPWYVFEVPGCCCRMWTADNACRYPAGT